MDAKTLIEQVRMLNNSKDPSFNAGWKGACDAIDMHLSQASRVTIPGNCEAPNGGGHTTADCPGEECRRTGQCQVA